MDKNIWEITIMKLNGIYKVTRRFPLYSIAETKIFKTKKEAELQMFKWLKS